MATVVYLRRIWTIQKGIRPVIIRLAMSSRMP
ncbi:hypothetical protein Tco_1388319, partial [Tanacetum coccineum]